MRVSKSSTETDHPHKQQEVQAQHLDNLSRKMSQERRLNHSHSRQQKSSVHLSRKYFMDRGFRDLEIERKNFCSVKNLGVCFVWWPSVCISKNEGPLLGSSWSRAPCFWDDDCPYAYEPKASKSEDPNSSLGQMGTWLHQKTRRVLPVLSEYLTATRSWQKP